MDRKITFLFLSIIMGMIPCTTFSQSVNVNTSEDTRDHPINVFQIGSSSVLLQDNVVKYLSDGPQISGFITYGVSPDRSVLGFLSDSYESTNAFLLSAQGDTLVEYQPSKIEPNDPSVAIYPFENGSTILQQNIGRFSFYSPLGDKPRRYSSVTGSEGGEAISKLTASLNGGTVVLYNPKVISNEEEGSRAHLAEKEGGLNTIYRSYKRKIDQVHVTDDGQYIGILTLKDGTDPTIHIYDRHGIQLFTRSFEDKIKDFSLSGNVESLLVYSENRALAYKIPSGEKVGSTSFRTTIVKAEYFPESQLILALTGQFNQKEGQVRKIEIQAVNLEKREIASSRWPGRLGFHPRIQQSFKKMEGSRYMFSGGSKKLLIDVNF